MKLLIITEGYYPHTGGLEKIVTEVAEGLYSTGRYEIQVVTFTNEEEYSEMVHGISVLYIPLHVFDGKRRFICEFLNARKRLKQILTENYDFVSIQYMGYFSAIFSSLRTKTKYSISIHGTDVTGQQSKLIKRIQKRVVDRASVVISNSYYLADVLEKKLNISLQQKLRVIWNGIHMENYETVEKLTEAKVIVAVGRFAYKKGFDVLIEAFAQVVKSCPDATLVIAGDGVEKSKCEQLSENLGVKEHIEFLGTIPNENIANVFARGKIFVCPSRNESFGIVVLEAMALGIPVIATDSGGVTEILDGGKYGCIVPREDFQSLAQKMIELLCDDVQCIKLHNQGLHRIKEFTIEKVIARYDEIIMKYI